MLKKLSILRNSMKRCILSKNEIEENELEGYYIVGYNEDFSKGEWGNYVKGKREGIGVNWDKTFGSSKGNYVLGELKGTVEYRYIDGNSEYCEIESGIKNGSSILKWKNGGSEIRIYRDNLKEGEAIRFFKNGAVEKLNYIGGKIEGKSVYEFSNGNKIEKEYKNDEVVGERVLIFCNGTKKILSERENIILEKENKDIETCLKLFTELFLKVINELEEKLEVLNNKFQKEKMSEENELENIKDIYGRKQGKWIINEINGEKREGNFVDNEKDGEWITYKDRNFILIREFYKKGKLLEYENRSKKDSGLIKWQKDDWNYKQGEWIIREENGILKSIKYKNDNLEGEYKSFYQNGNKYEIGSYKNNKFEGEYIKYSENGQIKEKGIFINGKRNGEWLENYNERKYMNNEKIKWQIISNYRKDSLHGNYKKYKNGEIVEIGEYKYGNKIGKWIELDENDNRLIGEYFDGKKIGKWIKIISGEKVELSYRDGLLVGEYVIRYKNGNIRKKQLFMEEGKVLFEKEYYSNGKLKNVIKRIYEKGKYLQVGLRLDVSKDLYNIIEVDKEGKNKTLRKYVYVKDILANEQELLEFLKLDILNEIKL